MEWFLDDFRNLTQRAFFIRGTERETKRQKQMNFYQTNRCEHEAVYLKVSSKFIKLVEITLALICNDYFYLASEWHQGQAYSYRNCPEIHAR
jgi:hypothetical protein